MDWKDEPKADRIIVALDCTPDEACAIAERLSGQARWVKVGMTLYYAQGPSIVRRMHSLGFRVFVDLKLHDIPYQVYGAAESLAQAGADLMTVHALGGELMLSSAAKGARHQGLPSQRAGACARGAGARDAGAGSGAAPGAGAGAGAGARDAGAGAGGNSDSDVCGQTHSAPAVAAITVLTSMDDDQLQAIGIQEQTQSEVERLALLAKNAELDGIVCSPKEAAAMRALLGPDAWIVTPGVRPIGAALGDQSRVSTPQAAFEAGASHLVIGRPITRAEDPKAAFAEIVEEL